MSCCLQVTSYAVLKTVYSARVFTSGMVTYTPRSRDTFWRRTKENRWKTPLCVLYNVCKCDWPGIVVQLLWIMEHSKCQAKFFFFFCGLKVNWLGEVRSSAVIPEISPCFPQLPVISVVRETETQLLPDVGAIVTCKVWNKSFQRIGTVVVFGFVSGAIGFSYLIRWPASTPDTPRSTSCMWARRRWRTASGGQSGTRGVPQSHVCFIVQKLNGVLLLPVQKRRCARYRKGQGETVFLMADFFLSLTIGGRRPPEEFTFFFFILQVETYKSFRPGDIVLAKVVSFTRCRSETKKWFHCLCKVIRAANQSWNYGYYD